MVNGLECGSWVWKWHTPVQCISNECNNRIENSQTQQICMIFQPGGGVRAARGCTYTPHTLHPLGCTYDCAEDNRALRAVTRTTSLYLTLNTSLQRSLKVKTSPCASAGFFPGMSKLGVWGRKSPSGIQGWSPGGGLEAKLSEADDRLWK